MELAVAIILLCLLILLWLTWLTAQWHKEKTKNKILKAENDIYKDFILQKLMSNGKEETNETKEA